MEKLRFLNEYTIKSPWGEGEFLPFDDWDERKRVLIATNAITAIYWDHPTPSGDFPITVHYGGGAGVVKGRPTSPDVP